jgi:hypothetical protein
MSVEDRFWLKTVRGSTDDECWMWMGAMSGRYGKLFIGRDEYGRVKSEYAHRISYEMYEGPIPDGMEIDHTCNNGWCVNYRHLEVVTGFENKSRQGSRQTHCVHGHEYTAANTYLDRRGQRRCRACAAERRAAA